MHSPFFSRPWEQLPPLPTIPPHTHRTNTFAVTGAYGPARREVQDPPPLGPPCKPVFSAFGVSVCSGFWLREGQRAVQAGTRAGDRASPPREPRFAEVLPFPPPSNWECSLSCVCPPPFPSPFSSPLRSDSPSVSRASVCLRELQREGTFYPSLLLLTPREADSDLDF